MAARLGLKQIDTCHYQPLKTVNDKDNFSIIFYTKAWNNIPQHIMLSQA